MIMNFKYRFYFFTLLLFFVIKSEWSYCQNRPHFEKQLIQIGRKKVVVEIADTPTKTSYGLMHRRVLSDNEGMLFVFSVEEPLSFWMKNTFVDLTIAFFDKEKSIINFHDMKATKSELQTQFETYKSLRPAQYALEMRLGWFKRNNIKVGDKLILFSKK